MVKKAKRTVGNILLVLLLFLLAACDSKKMQTITELGKTYEESGIKITATDIITLPLKESSTKKDYVAVAVKFVVNNDSDSVFRIGSSFMDVYVDDVLVQSRGIVSDANRDKLPGGIISGSIAPGKRAEGYWIVDVPKDTRQIEMISKIQYENFVSFVFDVPPLTME